MHIIIELLRQCKSTLPSPYRALNLVLCVPQLPLFEVSSHRLSPSSSQSHIVRAQHLLISYLQIHLLPKNLCFRGHSQTGTELQKKWATPGGRGIGLPSGGSSEAIAQCPSMVCPPLCFSHGCALRDFTVSSGVVPRDVWAERVGTWRTEKMQVREASHRYRLQSCWPRVQCS